MTKYLYDLLDHYQETHECENNEEGNECEHVLFYLKEIDKLYGKENKQGEKNN